MALNKDALKQKLLGAAKGGMPGAATLLSQNIKSYCETGTPVKGIKVTLAPCSGAGWTALASQATNKGVADTFISVGLATELAASQTTIMTPEGPVIIPSVFNSGAKVPDMSNCKDADECWDKIAQAIIDYVKPELA